MQISLTFSSSASEGSSSSPSSPNAAFAEAPTPSTSSHCSFPVCAMKLKRTFSLKSRASAASSTTSAPLFTRSASSSSSESAVSSSDMSEISPISNTRRSTSPPRRSSSLPTALHAEAKRIYETHYVLVDSPEPSPPSSPILSPVDVSVPFTRRPQTQPTTVQECTVM